MPDLVNVRTTLQPTQELEVDEHDRGVLEHQGLLWNGTDEELARLHTEAGLPFPAPAKPTAAATDKQKEG